MSPAPAKLRLLFDPPPSAIDISALTFEEWVRFVFDHPVAEPQWHWDAEWEQDGPAHVVGPPDRHELSQFSAFREWAQRAEEGRATIGWRGTRSCWPGVVVVVLGVWAILLSLGSVGPAGAAERVAGYVVTVDGYGYLLGSGEGQWIPLEVRRRVSYGDQLMTLADSRLQLYLWGDVVFILGPDSQAELLAPRRGARERVLRLSLGSFRLLALAGAPEARLLVVTPTAVTAVRGTEVMGEVDKENTSIAVVRGEVEVQGTAKGGTVLLRAGQGTDIAAGQDPTEPVLWQKERLERLRAITAVKLFW